MPIVSGPIWQIGCVVSDLNTAEAQYSRWFGVPEWTRFPDVDFGPQQTYRGKYRGQVADYAIRVSLGYAGSQQIELIEPARGENLYTEFLRRCGSGVHHLAWIPDDFDAALDEAQRQGLEPAQSGASDDMEFVYFETTGTGTHAVELLRISPRLARMFEGLQASAAAAH